MNKENVNKELMKEVFDLAKEKDIDLDVAFAQHKNLTGTYPAEVYEDTRKYVHENYTELCKIRKEDPTFSELEI